MDDVYDIETKAQSSRFAAIEEIKKKSIQEPLAIPKSVFQKFLEDFKNAGISVL